MANGYRPSAQGRDYREGSIPRSSARRLAVRADHVTRPVAVPRAGPFAPLFRHRTVHFPGATLDGPRYRTDPESRALQRPATAPALEAPCPIPFFTADMLTFALFLVWSLFVGVIDNVLKPLLLGRGVTVPMWVVFVGAIGGLLSHGLIGLFVGPVVLVLGYALLLVWVQQGAVPAANAGNAQQAGTNPGSASDASPETARSGPPGGPGHRGRTKAGH
jgi:hypothetical protein